MPSADTLLADACESGIACLNRRDLLIVIAQSVSGTAASCSITTTELPNGTDGTPYSETIEASSPGGTFAVATGALPDGLTLHADGTLDGTPTLANPYDFTVQATLPSGATCTQDFTITIIPNEPPVFEPPQAANLLLWLRPEELDSLGLNDGDPITNWADHSGNNHNFIPVVGGQGARYKIAQINGESASQYDGTLNTAMAEDTATPILGTTFSIFIVLKFDAAVPATGREWIYRNGQGGGYGLAKWDGDRIIFNQTGTFLTDSPCTTDPELWSVVRTSAPLARMAVNGTPVVITNNTAVFVSAAPAEGQQLGYFSIGNFLMSGVISEVMVWDLALSPIEQAEVETYLLAKYAL